MRSLYCRAPGALLLVLIAGAALAQTPEAASRLAEIRSAAASLASLQARAAAASPVGDCLVMARRCDETLAAATLRAIRLQRKLRELAQKDFSAATVTVMPPGGDLPALAAALVANQSEAAAIAALYAGIGLR